MLHFISYFLSLFLIVNFSKCGEVTFTVSLATPNLELNCKYKLAKGEKFDQVSIKKDGQTFISFNGDNKDHPEFTKVNGIDEVDTKGGGQVTVKNFKAETFGVYQCSVFYIVDKKTKSSTKKLSIKLQSKCKPEWKQATTNNLPADIFIAGTNNGGGKLAFCRFTYSGVLIPGMADTQKGCVVSWNGGVQSSNTFEILTGTGFEWGSQAQGGGTPLNSHQAGKDDRDPDNSRPLFAGKCIGGGDTRIGKIDFESKMYYPTDTSELSDCNDPHDILICNQS